MHELSLIIQYYIAFLNMYVLLERKSERTVLQYVNHIKSSTVTVIVHVSYSLNLTVKVFTFVIDTHY